jgi:cellulose synthase (UDP-forming)
MTINEIDLRDDASSSGPPSGRQPVRAWRTPVAIRLLIVVNFIVAGFYALWWCLPGHVGSPVLFVGLALAEAFTFAHVLGLWWSVWSMHIHPPPEPTVEHTIDVVIPTYGEPIDVLHATVAAAVAMDAEHRTVVLDDARRSEVEELAGSLGADYLTRTTNEGAKAGNINAALPQLTGELMVVFDADHVPRPDFLACLVGYFEDPDVAFVQTPQYYANGLTNRIARGAYQQQAVFYGPICRGKNGVDAAFCCGTNVVFRRTALDSVGGFDESSVVEDFVTSMHLHSRGWRSVYYPYVLADGLGPTNLHAYFGQQLRWAVGSIGGLMTGEPFKKGLSRQQRIQYLLATSFYFVGLVTAVYVALPLLYMFFGVSAFSTDSGTFLFFYGPYLVLGLATLRWGLGRQLRLEHLQFTFGTFPIYAVAGVSALLRRKASFKVTSKEEGAIPRPPRVAWVTVLAFGATIIAVALGPVLRPLGARTLTNMAWGLVNVALLAPIALAVVRERRLASNHSTTNARTNSKTSRSGGQPDLAEALQP